MGCVRQHSQAVAGGLRAVHLGSCARSVSACPAPDLRCLSMLRLRLQVTSWPPHRRRGWRQTNSAPSECSRWVQGPAGSTEPRPGHSLDGLQLAVEPPIVAHWHLAWVSAAASKVLLQLDCSWRPCSCHSTSYACSFDRCHMTGLACPVSPRQLSAVRYQPPLSNALLVPPHGHAGLCLQANVPSVVNVLQYQTLQSRYSTDVQTVQTGAGSGFFWDKQGGWATPQLALTLCVGLQPGSTACAVWDSCPGSSGACWLTQPLGAPGAGAMATSQHVVGCVHAPSHRRPAFSVVCAFLRLTHSSGCWFGCLVPAAGHVVTNWHVIKVRWCSSTVIARRGRGNVHLHNQQVASTSTKHRTSAVLLGPAPPEIVLHWHRPQHAVTVLASHYRHALTRCGVSCHACDHRAPQP